VTFEEEVEQVKNDMREDLWIMATEYDVAAIAQALADMAEVWDAHLVAHTKRSKDGWYKND